MDTVKTTADEKETKLDAAFHSNAQIDLVFASSQQKMSNRLLARVAHHFPSFSRSHDAVIRVYDETRNVIETHAHAGDFREF
jgi:hypothetical protein